MKPRLAALLILAGASCPGWAQPRLDTNDVVFKSSNWYVVRSVRARGATIGCTGFYKSERDVQLSVEQLIVKVPGELREVVVRFNDEVSAPLRPPTKLERQLGAVVIAGEQFEKLQASRRLALEIATTQKRRSIALRLQGLPESLANIRDGCPLPAKAAGACTEPLIARMRANGVSAAQVESICK
jgi:hypothetical protein